MSLVAPNDECSSSSSTTSRSDSDSSDELQLGASTIAMLDGFLAQKAEEQRLFEQFEARALQLEAGYDDPDAVVGGNKSGITVEEFKTAFVEDWQLSQFW